MKRSCSESITTYNKCVENLQWIYSESLTSRSLYETPLQRIMEVVFKMKNAGYFLLFHKVCQVTFQAILSAK